MFETLWSSHEGPLTEQQFRELAKEYGATADCEDAIRLVVCWNLVGGEFDQLDEYIDWELFEDGTLKLANYVLRQRDSSELPALDPDGSLEDINRLYAWLVAQPDKYSDVDFIIEVLYSGGDEPVWDLDEETP